MLAGRQRRFRTGGESRDLAKSLKYRVSTFGAWIMRSILRIREKLDRQIR